MGGCPTLNCSLAIDHMLKKAGLFVCGLSGSSGFTGLSAYSLVQPDTRDRPNRPEQLARSHNSQMSKTTLADFFSMLLAFLGRMGNKRRIELLHLGAAAFRACHFVGFMLLQG
jgi:hypothetical protein